MEAKLITFMKLNIPEDFLVISVLVTCSSLVSTWSRLVPAQKPTPIAQPWRSKSLTFLQTKLIWKKNQIIFAKKRNTSTNPGSNLSPSFFFLRSKVFSLIIFL